MTYGETDGRTDRWRRCWGVCANCSKANVGYVLLIRIYLIFTSLPRPSLPLIFVYIVCSFHDPVLSRAELAGARLRHRRCRSVDPSQVDTRTNITRVVPYEIIQLIFKIWKKIGNIRFVRNLIGDIYWNYYDDYVITVTSLVPRTQSVSAVFCLAVFFCNS